MKQHDSLILLSQEHHHILCFAQVIKHGGSFVTGVAAPTSEKLEYAYSFYTHLLRRHLEREDTILIPAVQGIDAETDLLLAQVLAEHAEIEDRFHELDRLREEDAIGAALEELGCLVEAHVHKEECQVFQRIQEVVAEKVLTELKRKLEAYSGGHKL